MTSGGGTRLYPVVSAWPLSSSQRRPDHEWNLRDFQHSRLTDRANHAGNDARGNGPLGY